MSSWATHKISSIDRGGWVAVTTCLMAVWMFIVFIMRVLIRIRANRWGLDDWAITGSTVLAIAHMGTVLRSIHDGNGVLDSLLTKEQLGLIKKECYMSQLFYTASICVSSCSSALLIFRLAKKRGHLLVARLLAIFTGLWTIGAVLLLSLRGNLAHPWTTGDDSSVFARWIAIETVGMTIDISQIILAAAIVRTLSVSIKLKTSMISAFSVRMLLIIPIILRLFYLQPSRNESDPTFLNMTSLTLAEVCMHFSIIAACIPCMKVFLQAMDAENMNSVQIDQEKTVASVSAWQSEIEAERRTWMPSFLVHKPIPPPPRAARGSVVSYYSTNDDNFRQIAADIRRSGSKSKKVTTTVRSLAQEQEEWMRALANPAMATPLMMRTDTLGFEVTVDAGSPPHVYHPSKHKRGGSDMTKVSELTLVEDEEDEMYIMRVKEVTVEWTYAGV